MSQLIKNDFVRQGANLILAPAMWVFSTLPQVMDWGRTASEFSDQNDSLLVPSGTAFSIWFPIFILTSMYAVLQARPSQKENPVFRAAGGWTAIGFLCVTLWALISAHAPDSWVLWGTAFIFVPTVFCLVRALMILIAGREVLVDMNSPYTHSPLSTLAIGLIAGWTSLALFLNWTPLIGALTGAPEIPLCIVMLFIALAMISLILRQTGGSLAYAFPPIWGLIFLASARYKADYAFETLGILALVGAAFLTLYALFLRRRARRSVA